MIVAGFEFTSTTRIAFAFSALQRLAGLRAGIVELAGLADDDRAGADDEDGLNEVSLRLGIAGSVASSTAKP
jgi:hypothetical protein